MPVVPEPCVTDVDSAARVSPHRRPDMAFEGARVDTNRLLFKDTAKGTLVWPPAVLASLAGGPFWGGGSPTKSINHKARSFNCA